MPSFLIKRIVNLLLSIWIISMCIFFLQKNAPGDVVLMQNKSKSNSQFYVHPLEAEKIYRAEAFRLGLDLPLFYISFSPNLLPDTFFRIQYPEFIKIQKELLYESGNWNLVQDYYQKLQFFFRVVSQSNNKSISIFWKSRLQEICITNNLTDIKLLLDAPLDMRTPFNYQLEGINKSIDLLSKAKPSFISWFPTPRWHGMNNQYHVWFGKVLKGDMGVSYRDGRRVQEKLKEAIPWTLWVNGLAILLAYLFSLPTGIFMAILPQSKWTIWINNLMLGFYAIPAFWVGSLLLYQATLPEWGFSFFSISGWTFFQQNGGFISNPLPFLLQISLPVFCMTYGLAAYLTNYMQASFTKVLKEPYILYARSKGISKFRLYFKHVLPNALLPQIVFIAGVFPALITGSVVIEVIFNIPGMGRLLIDSIVSQDWPTVYSFVLLVAGLTALGLILSDILLTLSDPRIRFSSSKNETA